MKDNFDEKLDALFAAARTTAPDTSRAEFAFETRLAARLRAESSGSIFAWAWRLCPFFAALALAVGWWSHATERTEVVSSLVSEAAPASDEQMLVAYMTGDHR
jgi:hypothetical protein